MRHRRGTSDNTASIRAVLHSARTAFEALGMDGWQRQATDLTRVLR